MTSETLDELLNRYPPPVQSLARSARALIVKVLPDADETIDAAARVIGYGYGAGYKGMICTLLLSKTGVKIGIAHGAALPDPNHLLAGSGKVHKFVQLRSVDDLRTPGLRDLLKASREAARRRHAAG